LDYLTTQYKPITNTVWVHAWLNKVWVHARLNKVWVRARLCKLQKGYTRLAATSGKVYQLLAHGRCFSPASSITKTGCHDIAKILLKVALNTKNQSSFILQTISDFLLFV
jgi:hypothetical protein